MSPAGFSAESDSGTGYDRVHGIYCLGIGIKSRRFRLHLQSCRLEVYRKLFENRAYIMAEMSVLDPCKTFIL